MTAGISWHYCKTHVLHAIIKNQEFWLGNILYMNDSSEFNWARSIALEELKDKTPSDRNEETFLDELRGLLADSRFQHIYCGCFSELEDDLSQWRGYADEGKGVAIGIDLPAVLDSVKSGNLTSTMVVYDEAKQRQAIKDCISDGLSDLSALPVGTGPLNFVPPLATAATTYHSIAAQAPEYKHPCFHAEREVRLILSTSVSASFIDPIVDYDVYTDDLPNREPQFYDRGNILVPYFPISCPRNAIKHIRLGPKFGGEREKDAIRLLLAVNKMDGVDVVQSVATYR